MIGGQVLIAFFGGQAFKIVPLNGKEWGLSIGLGAISLPWGALIRKFPDAWAVAMVPKISIPLPNIWPFKKRVAARRKAALRAEDIEKAPLSQSEEEAAAAEKLRQRRMGAESSDEEFVAPAPLRTLTSIRGKRATTHIRRGFREYMHDQKSKVKVKAKGGSKVDVSTPAPGVGGKLPETA
jgi:Ca2+-transporting ATPase